MSDSQQPQTPLARLEQLERQIASKVEEVVQGLRAEIGDGVRVAGEEIQRLLEAVKQEAPAEAPEPAEPEASAGPDLKALVDATARIDGQSGQADVIRTLLEETAPYASRAVFFLIRQQQIRAWSSRGFGSASGRIEGIQSTADKSPWTSVQSGATVALESDQIDAFAQTLGASAGTQAAWIPFILRGQIAGALFVDRREGEGELDVAALQLLTHCAARSLETAASNPGVSATLQLRGTLPEVMVEEHTIAVDDEPAGPEDAEEVDEPTAEDLDDESGFDEDESEAAFDEDETDATDATEEESVEIEDEDEPEDDTDVADDIAEAVEPAPEIAVPEITAPEVDVPAIETPQDVAIPDVAAGGSEIEDTVAEESEVEELDAEVEAIRDEGDDEQPAFEMVEEAPEFELEPGGDELPAEALAEPPEVPDIEIGEPVAAPELEDATAPEVPDVEIGASYDDEPEAQPDVSTEDIEFEAEEEPPLEEDTNIWEVEEDEPTAVGDEDEDEETGPAIAAEPQAAEPATPEPEPAAPAAPAASGLGGAGSETVRIDTANLPQTPAQAASAADVQYPSSFAEPPPPVQSPPPTFAEPETPDAEEDEVSSAQVAPPPDLAPPVAPPEAPAAEPPPEPEPPSAPETPSAPESQVTPPADATPASQVTPPEAAGGSTEVRPPTDLEGPGLAFAAPTPGQAERERDDAEEALHEEARRLARLLVSEIKLYNEEIIEEGRRTGNIYDRLKDDIDRSRQMYEERIDPRLADQEDYFHQELVQRLAGGDESLLGV